MTAQHVVVNGTVYVKHKHQHRVMFTAGARYGTLGWLIRKNGSMWLVLTDAGDYVSVGVGDLDDVFVRSI